MNRLFMPLAAVVCLAALSGTAMAQGYCRPSGYLGDAYSGYPGAGYGVQPYHQPANQYQPIGRGAGYGPVPYQSIGGGYGYGGGCAGGHCGVPRGGYRGGLFPRVRRLLGRILPPYDGRY